MSNGTIELPPVEVSPGSDGAASGGPSGSGSLSQEAEVPSGSGFTVSFVNSPGGFNSSTGQYFDQITAPQYLTRAVVIVNGQEYFEWESVTVTLEIGGRPPRSCRLTMSEQEPWPEAFAFFRVKPGDTCTVVLDGYKAFDGVVIVRQVAYNATSHAVEIQAVDYATLLDFATVKHETGEFKGQDFMGIAQQVAGKLGVNVQSVGGLGGDKIPRATVTPGETAWEFIEKLARQAGAVMTSDPNGNLVLMAGGYTGGGSDIVEGRDILEGREHISLDHMPSDIKSSGQAPGTDDLWGAKPTSGMDSDGQQGSQDAGLGNAPQRILSEIPAFTLGSIQNRLGMEQSFNDAVKIEVEVTLLGWQTTGGGGIWLPGRMVHLNAPMLIMNRSLYIKKVVFTQDNSTGTRSTLTLVNRIAQQAAE